MLEKDSIKLATEAFVQTFGEPMTAADVAPTLTCWEGSVIAMLLDVHGASDAAVLWLDRHAEGHDDGDEPHGLAQAWLAALPLAEPTP